MAILVIGGLVLLGALVLVYQLRSARRDSRSVEAHHELLDRLQHAAEAHPDLHPHPPIGPHVRVVPNVATAEAAAEAIPPLAAEAHAPPPPPPPPSAVDAPVPAGASRIMPEPEPVTAPAGTPAPPPAPSRLPVAAIHPIGSRGRLRHVTRARPGRRVAAAATALMAAGAATAIGLAATGNSSPSTHRAGAHGASPPSGATHPTPPPSPATTAPSTAPTATATSTGPTSATYVVTSVPVNLTLAASNRCWVELRSGSATGPVLFEGLLVAGTSHDFSNSSGVWLRLGYPPGVSVRLDGSPVNLPSTTQPYDVSVQTA